MCVSPIKRAVQIAGGQSALARFIGVKPQAVQQWVASGRVPPVRVPRIVEAVGGAVSHHDLRPDIFPRERVNDDAAA